MSILGKMAGGLGKGQRLQGKIVLGIVAFVLLSKGFDGLQKAIKVRMSGNAVTGEVVQHLTECTARIRDAGRWQRFDVPCNSLVSLRERYGFSNVRSYRKRQVMVRFVRENGQVHFAKVRPSRKFVRWQAPIGSKVALVYNPRNPDRIQAQPDWKSVQSDLLFFAGGVGLLIFILWSMVGPLFTWLALLVTTSSSGSSGSSGARASGSQRKPNEIIEALQKAVDSLGKSSTIDDKQSDRDNEPGYRSGARYQQTSSEAVPTSRGAVKRMYLRPRNWRQRPVGNPGKYEPGSWFGFAR